MTSGDRWLSRPQRNLHLCR